MGNDKSKLKQSSTTVNENAKAIKTIIKHSSTSKISEPAMEMKNDFHYNMNSIELLLFGCDGQNQQKIIGFDSSNETFINLPKSPSLQIYNYGQAISMTKDLIALTGGTNKEKSYISSQAFLYNKDTNNVSVLPNMSQSRFSHISVYHKNRLCVFGGRSKPGDNNILSHCEYVNITDEKNYSPYWTPMPESLLKRCTGFALIYNDEIYLIGGYTGQRKRSKKIEKFSWDTQTWEIINLRLLYGAERGLILPGNNPNEFMIFGGKIRSGDTNLIFTYNLASQTYSYVKEMTGERVLQKGFESQINKYIYMIGGDTQNSIEKAKRGKDHLNWEWIKVPTNLPLKEQIKQFAHSQSSTIIPYTNENISYAENFIGGDKKHFMFGTDCEPFIAVLDVTNMEIKFKPAPNPLRLYGYQGVVRIMIGKYFICGGLFYSRKKISRDAFIYDGSKHTVIKCQKMIGMRYTMNVLAKDDKVFVIGGRSYGGDNEGILNTCECYDTIKNEWKIISPLNKRRCTAMSFLINNVIYIAGGYNGNVVRETSFETYNETDDFWNFLSVELLEPLEASLVLSFENKIIFLGGRNKSGDCNLALIYDYSFGIDTMHLETNYKLMNRKCLHKHIPFEKHCLLLGGEKYESGKFLEFIGFEFEKNTINIIIDPKNVPKQAGDFSLKVMDVLRQNVKDSKLQKYGFV